ncbi:RRM_5 domain-containing protein [Cephalotus follicularis]|uniref:RRM_5 domain-containing protein n=1 Tax=Cephalotus follicularis TaxID=3775 RepID=A0A1Q3B6A3_CEPFO|nr:RRM_5 domain-containing protein [Cephalotus follicularis]
MPEPIPKREEEEEGDDKTAPLTCRKEKRKAMKKEKRRQARKEIAAKERDEEEKRANDPEEQRKLKLMEEEEAERRERALKEFEERERALIETLERKRIEEDEEEEERRKLLEESNEEQVGKENECGDDGNWEYLEEGPAEIIFQGNEIILRKKKVRIPKKGVDHLTGKEDADRPTSNPLPPQSEVFADYQNASLLSAQQVLENVAQQVPNFGTEQDKAHCPFHLKTGSCRFGHRCSRVHFYPDKSCTLLIKNMYNGPGLAWEQDEGLEFTDEEVERSYEEFYDDVHTEFLKFGEIVNFKVCKNGAFHLRGNVYVHYKSLESAFLAYQSINGRYFAGKQVKCEFINVTRWKVAICGEYMKTRFKTCSHGMICNFIHCFRNPGGDYEWADWDKPPPKHWVKKMVALFGYCDELGHEKQMEQESGQLRNSTKMVTVDADRDRLRRSRSSEMDRSKTSSVRRRDDEHDVRESTCWGRHRKDDQNQVRRPGNKSGEENASSKDYHQSKSRSRGSSSDEAWSEGNKNRHRDRYNYHTTKNSTKHQSDVSDYSTEYGDNKHRTPEADSEEDWYDRKDRRSHRSSHTKKASRHYLEGGLWSDDQDIKKKAHKADGDPVDRDGNGVTNYGRIEESSRHHSRLKYRVNCEYQNDSDSIEECLDSDRDGEGHNHKKKSSGHCNEISKFHGDHENSKYRGCDTDSTGDWVDRDKERHRGQSRKRLRHNNEVSDFSDDQGECVKRREKPKIEGDRTNRHSLRRSGSSKDSSITNPLGNTSNYNGDHESSGSGQYENRYGSRYSSNENIDMEDRWEPERES